MTQPAPAAPLGFETLLPASWALFKRNWIVSAPLVIVTLAMSLLIGVFIAIAAGVGISIGLRNGDVGGGTIALFIVFYVVVLVAACVLSLWGVAATFGMADALWERGTTTFADGNAAFRSRGLALVVAFIGVFGLEIVALILALPTLFISLLALVLFTMYVMPSVVAGRRGGLDAIGESIRLVRFNFATSAITALVLYAIAYGISFIGVIPMFFIQFSVFSSSANPVPQLPPIPVIMGAGAGYLLTIVASLAYTGFFAVAITGLYRSLVAQLPPVPVTQPAPIVPGAP